MIFPDDFNRFYFNVWRKLFIIIPIENSLSHHFDYKGVEIEFLWMMIGIYNFYALRIIL